VYLILKAIIYRFFYAKISLYKDRKAVCADLKKIYGAINLDEAEFAKEEFCETRDEKYPNPIRDRGLIYPQFVIFFRIDSG
jgi:hypothetical protein